MKKKLLLSLLLPPLLAGCIDFSPKGKPEGEKVDVVADNEEMASNEHLKFKGVPIDGTLETFVGRMSRSGFAKVETGILGFPQTTEKGRAVLEGDFAGFKKCRVYVHTLTGQDLVSRITVHFPDQNQWQHLYGDYKLLKELLTEKYGRPASCVEKFESSYGPSDDNDRMYEVRMNRCKYITKYKTAKGEIVLSICNDGIVPFASLIYYDKINGNEVREHSLGDL